MARILRVRKLFLFRKSVGIEPVKQFHIHTEPAVLILRAVNMQVHHAWHNQRIVRVYQRKRLITLRNLLKDTGYDPVLHNQITVVHRRQLTDRGTPAQISFQDKCLFLFHLLPDSFPCSDMDESAF